VNRAAAPKTAAAPKATATHKVQKGETLYSIAKSRGLTVDQLRKINRLGKNSNIKVGQVLKFS
jgi:LysM repeat protein